MKVLVTGANGFIGSHVINRLCAEGHDVRGLIRNASKSSQLQDIGAEPVVGDVTVPTSLQSAVAGVDVIFHLAARVTDWGPWRQFEAATVRGTENLLLAAATAGVRRFVHVSSVAVYDDRFSRKHRVIAEDAPRGTAGDRLHGHYALAKLRSEEAVWNYHRRGELQGTVIRPTLVYGPRDPVTVPRLIDYLRSSTAAWIGRSNPVVDPIYVTDVAECVVKAGTHDRAIGQAYNVAPDHEIGVRDFWGELCRALDIAPPKFSIPYCAVAAYTAVVEGCSRLVRKQEPCLVTRAGLALFTEDRHHASTKAQAELDWKPRVALELGLRQTAEWLRSAGYIGVRR